MARVWWHVTAAVALVVAVAPPPSVPCSCQLLHPQQHVCEADYVVFARVRRLTETLDGHEAYKVRVKRLVKGSEKVEVMLRKGLLYTVPSTCKAELRPRTSYVISGNVAGAKPWVTLCSFASPVRSLTPKMKKGFKLLYQSGCDCPIMSCHHFETCPQAAFYCSWSTSLQQPDCQGRQSVCLRGPGGRCEWLQGSVFRRCMKTLRHNTTAPTLPRHNTTAPTLPRHNATAPTLPRHNATAPTLPRHNPIRLGPHGARRRKLSKLAYKRRLGLRGRLLRRPGHSIGYVPRKG